MSRCGRGVSYVTQARSGTTGITVETNPASVRHQRMLLSAHSPPSDRRMCRLHPEGAVAMSNLIRINRLKLIAGVSVSLLTVACASTPPESLAEVKADRALADKVQSAIDSDPEFFFQHVDVQAENGTVSLSGYVWSDPAIV